MYCYLMLRPETKKNDFVNVLNQKKFVKEWDQNDVELYLNFTG